MRTIIEDFRYGLRLLCKTPAFTCVALATLALGIGANTAIYTLLDQALLRRLPVKDPTQLVVLRYTGVNNGYTQSRTDDHFVFSYPMYRELRDRNSVFSGLIATFSAQVGVQWHNEPALADAELVSGNYFDVLGVRPAMGRLFVASDDVAQEANPVVILSFAYWQRRFGSDPRVLDQNISINGHPFTVIGVAAPGFHSAVSGDNPAIFVPMMMKPQITPGWNDLEARRSAWLSIIGRLKPGFTREQAQAGIDPVWHAVRSDELSQMGHSSQRMIDAFLTQSHLFLVDGSKGMPVSRTRVSALLPMMAMASLIVLIACANVGGLLLVRVSARIREISVRYALGAKRIRITQQLLAEGLLLGLAGGTAGVLLAPQICTLLMRVVWSESAGELSLSPRPDLRVLLFNFALTLFVSLVFSLAPAFQFWRQDPLPALKQQVSTPPRTALQLRRSMVIAQIGISLLLLVGTGLFVRTLYNLKSLDVGFTTENLLTFNLDLRQAGYERSETGPLYQKILDRLAALPGVRFAAATSDPELANHNSGSNITVAGYHAVENEDMNVEAAKVSPAYFSTLQLPLLAGHVLSDQDRMDTQKVAVVNESFARRYFGAPENAIGHYFCWGAGNVTPDIEIVGVVKDVRHTTLRANVQNSVFTPYLQEKDAGTNTSGMSFYVRTWQAPETAETTIRQFVHEFDSRFVLNGFRTMQEQIDDNLTTERAIALLSSSFGVLALLMAAMGIYGVLAYSTAQRTREIGLRMAVGATRTEVVRLVLADVLWMVGIGVLIGVPTSIALASLLRSQLFGVSTSDPLTLGIVCMLVLSTALLAAALPARRAAKVDPMVALRYE
jgi:putative ABC transport system permease protein